MAEPIQVGGPDRRRLERRITPTLAELTLPELRRMMVTTILFVIILVLFLWMVRTVIIATILGIIVAMYMRPVYLWLRRYIPNSIAASTLTWISQCSFHPPLVMIGVQSNSATHAVIDRSALAVVPESTDLVAAATLPLNALTAHQALDLLDLAPGQTLLVTGAAGGLGEYTVALGDGSEPIRRLA